MEVERMDHDRWFKELIKTFFEEFVLVFFPDVYEQLDFQNVTFLSEELFTDILVGEKRRVDLLIETKLKSENTLIIIHIEPQSYEQEHFSDRMFIYYSRLYEKYRRPIVPIAIFSYDKVKTENTTLEIRFPFQTILTFEFLKLELKKQNWRHYLKQSNPVAAALLSKMGYEEHERIEVKKEFLRLLVQLELDPARQTLVTGFFEKYLTLTKEEENILMEELSNIPTEEVSKLMEIMTSWEKKGIEKGIEQGIEKGLSKGEYRKALEVAKKMLEKQFEVEEIAEVTGLSLEEIRALIK